MKVSSCLPGLVIHLCRELTRPPSESPQHEIHSTDQFGCWKNGLAAWSWQQGGIIDSVSIYLSGLCDYYRVPASVMDPYWFDFAYRLSRGSIAMSCSGVELPVNEILIALSSHPECKVHAWDALCPVARSLPSPSDRGEGCLVAARD